MVGLVCTLTTLSDISSMSWSIPQLNLYIAAVPEKVNEAEKRYVENPYFESGIECHVSEYRGSRKCSISGSGEYVVPEQLQNEALWCWQLASCCWSVMSYWILFKLLERTLKLVNYERKSVWDFSWESNWIKEGDRVTHLKMDISDDYCYIWKRTENDTVKVMRRKMYGSSDHANHCPLFLLNDHDVDIPVLETYRWFQVYSYLTIYLKGILNTNYKKYRRATTPFAVLYQWVNYT